MNKKIIPIIVVTLTLLLIGCIVFLSLRDKDDNISEYVCTNNPILDNIETAGCYDAFSGNIYVQIYYENSNIAPTGNIRASFFDYMNRDYLITSKNKTNNSYLYEIKATRKPLDLTLIFEDFSSVIYCTNNKTITINYCSNFTSSKVNATLTLITNESISNFVPVNDYSVSDYISSTLLDKDQVWSAICISSWKCSSWERCVNGLQKRKCTDINKCLVPVNIPRYERYCNGSCQEEWVCDWSTCIDGYSTPACRDLNECGTEHDKPSRIICDKKCTPNIRCGAWTNCSIDYSFESLSSLSNGMMDGKETRTCVDTNNCINNYIESSECSTSVDIYVREFTKCGEKYVGVYSLLDNSLLASFSKSSKESSAINIDFSSNIQKQHCPYCYDNVLDGDETDVDCGGSCEKCVEKIVIEGYNESLLEKIVNFFSSTFS